MSTPHSRPSTAIKLLVAVGSIVLFLLLSELVLAWLQPDLYQRNQFFPSNRDIDFPEVYQRDSRLFWKFRPGITTTSKLFSNLSYHINSLGMRGPEIEKPKRGYRIIALGNSCTFGWGVSYDQTWTHQLQIILNDRLPGRDIEVINAGVPGYSSEQGKRYLSDKLLGLKPDMVLIMFGFNDHYPAGRGITDSEQKLSNSVLIGAQNLLARLRLYRLVRKLFLSATHDETPYRLDNVSGVKRVPRAEFFENLREMVDTARAHHVQPVLLLAPVASLDIYFGGATSNFHRLHEIYQQETIRAAQYEKAPLVNLQEAFDEHTDLFDDAEGDPIHFNAKGQLVAAEAVADVVTPLIESQ